MMATVSLVVLFVRYRLPSFFFFFSCRPSVRPFLSFVPASFHRALPLAISPPHPFSSLCCCCCSLLHWLLWH